MQLAPDTDPHIPLIQSYEPPRIRIRNQEHTHSLWLYQNQIHPWDVPHFGALDPVAWKALLGVARQHPLVRVVVIGTGPTHHWIPPTWLAAYWEYQIGVEIMDTHAACRTYNLLAAEGRPVIGAFMTTDPLEPVSG